MKAVKSILQVLLYSIALTSCLAESIENLEDMNTVKVALTDNTTDNIDDSNK